MEQLKDIFSCCDFCIHVIHEEFMDDDGEWCKGAPLACNLHQDEEHKQIVTGCGYCKDYRCFQ